MFRAFARSPLLSAYQSLLLPSWVVNPCSAAAVTITSSKSICHFTGGRDMRVTPTSSCISSGAGAGSPKLLYEQVRNFWGHEGRIGWRRKRRMERIRRARIIDPATPLIDELYPLPRDNMDSVPPGLFEEEREELTPEEERKAQNGILERINQQVKEGSEGRLFAVIFVNGKQFKVTPGDIIIAQGIFTPTVMDQIRFQKILLVGGKDFTLVGSPLLDEGLVRVEGTIVEKTLSYTKIVFKMLKGQNFKRFRFTKTPYSMIRINLIEMGQPLEAITSDSEKFIQQHPNI